MKMVFALLALVFVVFAPAAFAFDVSAADVLFAKRGEGDKLSNIRAARFAYEQGLSVVQGKGRVHVLQMLNRLDFYEGSIVSGSSEKKALYKACLDRTELMPKDAIEYTYWRGICLGLWSNEDGLLTALKNTGEVEKLLMSGRAKDPRFDGGGFDRGLAVVYLKVPPVNPFGPTRDPEKALACAERAIASPSYPGEPSPETATGDYFYNAYDARAQALAVLGRKAEARTVLQDAIGRIEQGDLPVGREPETLVILEELKSTLDSIAR